MVTTFHKLRVRGDAIHPSDYVVRYDATVISATNDMGTIRLILSQPSPNGNDRVSVAGDFLLEIERPIIERGLLDGD